MINAEAERIVAKPVSGGNADYVIRVDEVEGRGVHVELGEQGAFHAQLQAVPLTVTEEPVYAECFSKADLTSWCIAHPMI